MTGDAVKRVSLFMAFALAGLGVLAAMAVYPARSAFAQERIVIPHEGEPEEHIVPESSNPYSQQLDAIEEGKGIYFKFCVQCHGYKADGHSRFGNYAYDLRRFWQGYAQFIAIATAGRPAKGMPPWGKYLSGVQLAKVGAYLETLALKGANWK